MKTGAALKTKRLLICIPFTPRNASPLLLLHTGSLEYKHHVQPDFLTSSSLFLAARRVVARWKDLIIVVKAQGKGRIIFSSFVYYLFYMNERILGFQEHFLLADDFFRIDLQL